jgi:hypothetical protein
MEFSHRPEAKNSLQGSPERELSLSSGQAALRYHFEDLIREHHADRPLSVPFAMRGAGVIARLASQIRHELTPPEGAVLATAILAGGMTEGRPEEALLLAQLRVTHDRDGAENFVLPALGGSRDGAGVHIAPWMSALSGEIFNAPVGVISHIDGRSRDTLVPAYSPQAQEEALDHIERIAADVNAQGRRGPVLLPKISGGSILLGRILDTVVESSAAGDPVIYGEGRFPGAPLLSVFHLGVDRGREVAFRVAVFAVRAEENAQLRQGSPLFSGGLFLKEYCVAARRGPLAFEDVRIVDLVERAA